MTSNPTILVADHDEDSRAVMRQGLLSEGWQVVEAADREGILRAIGEGAVDLVTLDLHIGDGDGLALASTVRTLRNIPILIVTGQGDPSDRVRWLESGADDYLQKPFLMREVVLRIRHILDRYGKEITPSQGVLFDHSIFDFQKKSVRHQDGSPVELTGLELNLLELFLRHPGRVLSRDEISRFLRGHDCSPYDRTIDGHVARLRRKIEPGGDAPTLIRSVRGVGYVFAGEVRPEDSEDFAMPAADTEDT